MNNFLFENGTKFLFGGGCVKEYLASFLRKYGPSVLLVTEEGERRSGAADEVRDILRRRGKQTSECAVGPFCPRYEQVQQAARLCREQRVDLILGVGGSAVLDGCKASSLAAVCQGTLWEHYGVLQGVVDVPPLPVGFVASHLEAGAVNGAAGLIHVLVAYFSATGNTERVANAIAEATGGDLFEITPADPYTDDDLNWTDENSRVVQEYENPDARDTELVAYTPESWADYDVVFVGYPIWWYDAAWPVDGFVAENDFTGKTVIPFCTSSSSGLGESGQRLAQLAGAGTWLEGQRFRSSASQEDVNAWVESLGLN